MTPTQCVAVTLLISLVCIVGDYFLKKASQTEHPFQTYKFAVGTVVFALSAVGWVIVLPYMKLGAIGVVYGVSTVLFMALLGWLVFGERLRWQEGVGVVLGVTSIVLLARFAD